MSLLKIGVFGAGRGEAMIRFLKSTREAQIVAVCDKVKDLLKPFEKYTGVTCYTDFEKFILHDMDAVVLANYANEHAPYAIRCLNKGLHVFSEVLPVASLAEAAELVEAVEKSGKIYAYGENYCYMPASLEMKRMYESGRLGELEYAEGEYIHNCLPIWAEITYGEPDHWRNTMPATFYCTHSIGPILHATKLRPVSVTGFEIPYSAKCAMMGSKGGAAGIEMITLSNGAVLRSTHGNLCKNSIWYSMYGTKGRMESAREDADCGDMFTLYVNFDETEVSCDGHAEKVIPHDKFADIAAELGHKNSDYYPMHWFIEAIKGNKDADYVDVYEALDMALPGILAYVSILDGGAPKKIPDMRNEEERNKAKLDTRRMGKDFPPSSRGEIIIDNAVYERLRSKLKNKEKKQ